MKPTNFHNLSNQKKISNRPVVTTSLFILDDPFWKGRTCLNFVRSQSAPALECIAGPTEQVKQAMISLQGMAEKGL